MNCLNSFLKFFNSYVVTVISEAPFYTQVSAVREGSESRGVSACFR